VSSFCFDSLRRAVLAALTPLAICGIAQAQAFNVYEGQSQFENNWSDSSWNVTEDLANTSYIYEGSTSAQLTYTQAWAGFRVTSNLPFPAGYFSAMHLSITGGPTAGRSISVYFLVNGVQTASINLNRFIQGGSVAANVWRTATIPLSTFNIKPTDVVNSFTLQESSGGAQPAFWIGNIGWAPVPVLGPVKVAVNAGNVLRTVDPKHFGVNTDVWISNFTSSANTSLLSQSKFKSYRFPGGSASDGYNWVNNMNTDASGNTWGWSTNFDQFASVAVGATGGQCFITANYGSGTPAEAAAWVKYSNVTQKYGFKYW
jgi:hypothetical protein